MFVEALRDVLEPQFQVVGTVSDGQSLLASAKKLNPDVVVLEVSLPRLSGIDAARRLREIVPGRQAPFLDNARGTSIREPGSFRRRRCLCPQAVF
jgi:DNA-binding NarL/FixJ family response regulator